MIPQMGQRGGSAKSITGLNKADKISICSCRPFRRKAQDRMNNPDVSTEIFVRYRRRHFRDRAFDRAGGKDYIGQIMADEILERLSLVIRDLTKCLLVGQAGHSLASALKPLGIESVFVDA